MANKPSMDALRQKLIEQNTRGKTATSNNGGDNASYPFWNIPEGQTATVRFLPDGDDDNTFFWAERQVIKLPFAGVVGGDYPTDRPVIVTVPCVEMFGDRCPIIAATKPWWKDPNKETLARTYWKKRSYIFQGFVVQSPFEEQSVPENPIRRFVINPSIFEIIKNSLMDTEMEDMPVDFTSGRDFNIKKTRKGEYANYSTSSWSFRTRSLGENELGAIQQFGLFTLKDYLGRRPDADEMDAIKAMFADSLDGKPFDHDSYGRWYRAYTGSRDDEGGSSTGGSTGGYREAAREAPSRPAAQSTASLAQPEPSAPAASEGGAARLNANDILDRIRKRNAG